MISKSTIVLSLAMILSMPLMAKKLKQDDTLIKGKLENGMTYYIYPNSNPKGEAVYRLFIKSGSVLEHEDQRGLAHFLEHMAFNGTDHFSDIVKYLESKGARFGKDLNAHTALNETVYKLQLPTADKSFVDSTLLLLSDWAGRLTLSQKSIEKERGVILSEWLSKQGPENEAKSALLNEVIFNTRYAKRMTIGDTAVIRNFKRDELVRYYKQWYNPKLMAVAVAGDVDAAQVEQKIKEYFGPLESLPIKDRLKYPIPPYKETSYRTVAHPSFEQAELNIIRIIDEVKPVQTEKEYKAYLHRSLLNQLIRTRLNNMAFDQKYYKKARLSSSGFIRTANLFYGAAALNAEKPTESITAFVQDCRQMFAYGFTQSEINNVKKSYANSIARKAKAQTKPESKRLMDELYSDFYTGICLISPQEEERLMNKYIGSIDSTCMVRQLKKYSKAKAHYLYTTFKTGYDSIYLKNLIDSIEKLPVKPYIKNVDVPTTLLRKQPKGGSIISRQPIADIQAEELTLSNGVRIIYKQTSSDKENVAISGFRKGGLYSLDSARIVSAMYAPTVASLSGAGAFTRESLAQFLTGNTASVRFLIDKSRTGVMATANKTDLSTMLQLLYLKWTEPKADTKIFNQLKTKAIDAYKTSHKTPEDIFSEEAVRIMQGENYINRTITAEIIEKELNQKDILPVFNQCFGPADGYCFVVTSNSPLAEMEEQLVKYLGSLPSGKTQIAYIYPGAKIPHKAVNFEQYKGDSPKANVTVIFQQDKLDMPLREFMLKCDMMKSILRTKLLNRLREKMGKVYSVSVSASATILPKELGRESFAFVCDPNDVESLINAAMDEINQMIQQPTVFEKELADVKKSLIKTRMLDQQKSAFWGGAIRNNICYNEPDWLYLTHYDEQVNRITAQEMVEMLKKCFIDTPMIRTILYPKNK